MSGFTPSSAVLAGTGEQPLLVAVIGLLALVIIGLVAVAILLRRRNRLPTAIAQPPARTASTAPPVPSAPRTRPRPHQVRGGGGGGLAVATSSAMVCPTCRTEYHGLTYCCLLYTSPSPRDS